MTKTIHQCLSLLLSLSLTAAPTLAVTQDQTPLKVKENRSLIGQRDINNGQINLYSHAKEVALGRQMAAEVDRQSKLMSAVRMAVRMVARPAEDARFSPAISGENGATLASCAADFQARRKWA